MNALLRHCCAVRPARAVRAKRRSCGGAARVRAAAGGGFGPPGGGPRGGLRKVKGGKPATGFEEDAARGPQSPADRAAAKARDTLAAKQGRAAVPSAPDASSAAPPPAPTLVGNSEFEARLAALKASNPSPSATPSAAPSNPLASGPLFFDGPSAASPPATSPASAAPDTSSSGGASGLVKGIAVASVIVFLLVFGGASDLVIGTQVGSSGSGGAGAAAISPAAKKKLQALVDAFSAAPDAAALPRGQALAAAQAAAKLEQFDVSAAAYAAALSTPGGDADAFEALPGRVDALLRAGRAEDALSAADAFALKSAAELAPTGLDATDVALLRAKALAALPGRADDAAQVFENLIAANPDDFRPLLAKGLALRQQEGRALAADKALLRARVLAPKEARKMVDLLIGDR